MTSPGSTGSQSSGNHFITITSLLERILLRGGQMEKMQSTGQGMVKRGVKCPCPLEVQHLPSTYIHVFTNSKALCTPLFRGFDEGFIV